jgi:hypothetical protein
MTLEIVAGAQTPCGRMSFRRGKVSDETRRRTPDMNTFEIKIIEESGVLRFTLKGPGTHAHFLRAVTAIISETQSRDIWLVLCDATAMTNPLGAFEKFEAAVELARGADRRMKMAVVARVEAIDYIFENVARNRGVSVAVFKNEDAALQWLLGAKLR